MSDGKRGGDHELSILIRFGDGDRAGRGPSNVSTMIIQPPQQGRRRAGEGVFASLLASAGGGSGGPWAAASKLADALDVVARTAPANRP